MITYSKQRCKHNHYSYRGPLEHRHNIYLPFLGKTYMYICARCLGLFGGFFLLSLGFFIFPTLIQQVQALEPVLVLAICFFLSAPLVIDWLSQSKGLRHSTNNLRFTVGLLTALSGIIMLVGYQALLITLPLGATWYIIVGFTGRHLKKNRPTSFGCFACKNKLVVAKPVEVINL